MLDFYREYFHEIWVLSPSVDADEKWDWVKRQALVAENLALKRYLQSKQKDQDSIVGKKGIVASKRPFDPKIPEDHFVADYNMSFIIQLMSACSSEIQQIKKLAGKNEIEKSMSKYIANRTLLICDDMVGSGLFTRKMQDPFKQLNTNRRHHSMSIWMVSQSYKEFPAPVRKNWNCVVLFDIPNMGELKQIYEEFPCGMSEEQWMKAYNYCTSEEHGFMFINLLKPKTMRVMKNFDQVLYFGDSEE